MSSLRDEGPDGSHGGEFLCEALRGGASEMCVERSGASSPPGAGTARSPATFSPTAVERFLGRRLLDRVRDPKLAIVLGDQAIGSDGSSPAYSLRIVDRTTLWNFLRDPEYWLFEGYARGTIEIDGDLIELLAALKQRFSLKLPEKPTLKETVRGRLRQWRSRRRWRPENVAHHYDLGNDFYGLWLDRQLLYTCAYFESDGVSLEEAQVAKMDHVCRKLRLRPGERVIEAGCGWGALALHMARSYGVHVRAFNLSREQLAYGRERARRENLSSQVEFVEADWSEVDGRCDAFVSVGMLEHVGPENFSALGRVICRVLVPTGRGLIHTIGQNTAEPLSRWIERRIFPGAQPPTLQQMMNLFEPHNLAVHDVENLRPHYAETLAHWLARFETVAGAVGRTFGEQFVRMWRIYLAASHCAFRVGSLQLYQVLFAPIGSETLPPTRRDLYAGAATPVH